MIAVSPIFLPEFGQKVTCTPFLLLVVRAVDQPERAHT